MGKFSEEELKQRAFRRVAFFMRDLWEEKGSSDTRLLESFFIPDPYVVVGESVSGRGHREHVVPRMVICQQCHAMFRDGASLQEVADLIQRFLKIVHITKEEQHRLDVELGLKQSMPEGWTFSQGDVFARLKAAAIEYRRYDDQPASTLAG